MNHNLASRINISTLKFYDLRKLYPVILKYFSYSYVINPRNQTSSGEHFHHVPVATVCNTFASGYICPNDDAV